MPPSPSPKDPDADLIGVLSSDDRPTYAIRYYRFAAPDGRRVVTIAVSTLEVDRLSNPPTYSAASNPYEAHAIRYFRSSNPNERDWRSWVITDVTPQLDLFEEPPPHV